jgi:hypothetical protein
LKDALKGTEITILQGYGSPMYIIALFTIALIQNKPRCPLMDEWIKSMWYLYNGI